MVFVTFQMGYAIWYTPEAHIPANMSEVSNGIRFFFYASVLCVMNKAAQIFDNRTRKVLVYGMN